MKQDIKFLSDLQKLFLRDIEFVKEELNSYENEADIWLVKHSVNNSAGNLALHIAGNLQHFIGSVLGDSGYVRNRDAEFNVRNVSLEHIMHEIDKAEKAINQTLPKITEEVLSAEFPQKLGENIFTTRVFLLHLYGHLNYHLGQLNYHRRLISGI